MILDVYLTSQKSSSPFFIVFRNIKASLSDEKRLIHSLLSAYKHVGLTGRPVRNISQPVLVYFGLGLIKMQVEEKDNMLSISAWTKYVS